MDNVNPQTTFYFTVLCEIDAQLRDRFMLANPNATITDRKQHIQDFAFALCLMASTVLVALKEQSTETKLTSILGPELAEAAIEAIQGIIDERFKAQQERN